MKRISACSKNSFKLMNRGDDGAGAGAAGEG
jgi:hypothetical protein